MKKRFLTFVMALMMTFMLALPAQAAYQDMWAQVFALKNTNIGDSTLTPIATGITFKVLAAGSNTAETLYVYGDNTYTALTNPITTTAFAATTGGLVAFRVDPTDSTYDRYVDLIVVDTAGGYTATVRNFDRYTHKIVIDERPNVRHHGVIWYNGSTTNETTTGVQLPYMSAVWDVQLEVVTAGTSGTTLKVGLLSTESGGDADGYIVSRLVSTAGFIADTSFITSGASVDYYPVSTTGVFLAKAVTGTGVYTATKYLTGGLSRIPHFIVNAASARTISYTVATADGAAYGGYIHYWFSTLR